LKRAAKWLESKRKYFRRQGLGIYIAGGRERIYIFLGIYEVSFSPFHFRIEQSR
jgi:hypothetical protein